MADAQPHGGAWIGVDFDGTLATYDRWRGLWHTGQPIWPMVHRVRQFLDEGWDVRIFTARVAHDGSPEQRLAAEQAREVIQEWCRVTLGTVLPVTNVKDTKMCELWDDRAVQVEKNTGRIIGKSLRSLDGLDLSA